MGKYTKVLQYIGIGIILFFALGASATGDHFSALFLVTAAFLISPWRRLATDHLPEALKKKWILITAVAVLIVAAVVVAPKFGKSGEEAVSTQEDLAG